MSINNKNRLQFAKGLNFSPRYSLSHVYGLLSRHFDTILKKISKRNAEKLNKLVQLMDNLYGNQPVTLYFDPQSKEIVENMILSQEVSKKNQLLNFTPTKIKLVEIPHASVQGAPLCISYEPNIHKFNIQPLRMDPILLKSLIWEFLATSGHNTFSTTISRRQLEFLETSSRNQIPISMNNQLSIPLKMRLCVGSSPHRRSLSPTTKNDPILITESDWNGIKSKSRNSNQFITTNAITDTEITNSYGSSFLDAFVQTLQSLPDKSAHDFDRAHIHSQRDQHKWKIKQPIEKDPINDSVTTDGDLHERKKTQNPRNTQNLYLIVEAVAIPIYMDTLHFILDITVGIEHGCTTKIVESFSKCAKEIDYADLGPFRMDDKTTAINVEGCAYILGCTIPRDAISNSVWNSYSLHFTNPIVTNERFEPCKFSWTISNHTLLAFQNSSCSWPRKLHSGVMDSRFSFSIDKNGKLEVLRVGYVKDVCETIGKFLVSINGGECSRKEFSGVPCYKNQEQILMDNIFISLGTNTNNRHKDTTVIQCEFQPEIFTNALNESILDSLSKQQWQTELNTSKILLERTDWIGAETITMEFLWKNRGLPLRSKETKICGLKCCLDSEWELSYINSYAKAPPYLSGLTLYVLLNPICNNNTIYETFIYEHFTRKFTHQIGTLDFLRSSLCLYFEITDIRDLCVFRVSVRMIPKWN